ncbi:bifunctional metallophosphatase/5'-nucleotidase [Radiobacillus kanasensis]|uniref:bifunctional metallophosphatase/5'-nucleotidase n=1 Tax=Radiobacillus kanasensis TaxID=2844358 RepID=UPI001E385899|nr:bifunctional UDP-sugar hydrolase/5'-nucleotidase [Radiobacillus kanasensis]UFT98240.1 bifunctional metallophosphatase/5'-nucleotidase [Radiobacillus kanasensis]
MEEKIFLYYTNDLHSHFDNWPKIMSYLNKQKEVREREEQSYWLFDIGDHMDRSAPISEALLGKGNVDLLNRAQFDFATIGNNEGITLDHQQLTELYQDAQFQLLCANLTSKKGKGPDWLKATQTVQTKSGTTISVIGLTTPYTNFYNLLGWDIRSPYDTLEEFIPILKKNSDIIVLMSHLGLSEDQEIARRFPEIDVIMGGHTHHLLKNGENLHNTLLTAAGKHGYYVGEVYLVWDHCEKKLKQKQAFVTRVGDLDDDVEARDTILQLDEKASGLLGKEIVDLSHPLEVDWYKETPFMQDFVSTLQKWTDADIAFLNAGILIEGLEKGSVTYADVHRICPHPMNPCVVTLKGKEIVEVVRGALTKAFMDLQLKGLGFRGKVLGRMVFSGLKVQTERLDNGDEHVIEVMFRGKPIDKEQTYKIATADTFTFGKLLPEITRSEEKHYYLPELLRDLLVECLEKNYKK